jgi:hypothetical protein
MPTTTTLNEARTALSVVSTRTAALVATVPDTAAEIPGSVWTVREAAVHLALIGFRYAGMVHGEPNQYPSLDPEECARLNDQLNADIPETDPGRLAGLIGQGTERLLAATVPCDDATDVLFDGGTMITVPDLVATALAKHLLHGYDMAVAVSRPWPISRRHATLALPGCKTADPVAFLLVSSGRLSQWAAITLGLLAADDDRPELTLGYLLRPP